MTKIINDLKKVTAGTWVRVVLFLLGVVNYFLAAFGIDIIKFDNEQITQLVNAVYIAVTGFYTLWKNNNFTAEAQEAQQYLDDMKTVKGNVQPTAVTEEATNEDDICFGVIKWLQSHNYLNYAKSLTGTKVTVSTNLRRAMCCFRRPLDPMGNWRKV